MPHFLPNHNPSNHRRRHSWPYTGPEKRPLPIIKVSAPEEDAKEEQQHFLTARSPEDLFDDVYDDVSAGIVRSRTSTSHHHHHHHLWGHFRGATSRSKGGSGSYHGDDDEGEEEYHLSGSEEIPPTGSGSGSNTLRRIIRPPLDKARSLFAVPTTTPAGERVFVPYAVEGVSRQQKLRQEQMRLSSGGERRGRRGVVVAMERNHRRCHSEQPRAWREPSASLWTLEEE